MGRKMKRTVLLVSAAASFLVPFMSAALNVALPAMSRDFAVSATLLNWSITAYILATAAFILPAGRLGDLWGRKKVFLAGLTLFTFFTLLCPLASSFQLLLVLRTLQGAGGALIFATSVAMLSSACPPAERGRALGLNTAAVYLGISLGPPLGGILTQALGWRSIFFLTAVIAFFLLALTAWVLRGLDWRGQQGRFDGVGALLYAGSVSLLIYGLSQAGESLANLYLALGGVAALALFVLWESRRSDPLLPMRLFIGNRPFAFSNLAALVNYTATFGHAIIISFYLQTVKGLSPQLAGLLMLAQPLVQAIFSPLAGRAADRVEPRLLASLGMALSTISLAFFIFLEAGTPLFWVIANTVLMGLGFALFSSPNTFAVMNAVQAKEFGVASSTLGAMRLVGQSVAMALLSLLFALWLGTAEISPAVVEPFLSAARTSYGIAAALSFAAIFASLARGRSRRSPERLA
ncbi:MAG: MFS transporter [Coprothermobacterota bacterium]|nr:MFS transporter [Coprothermobacterota bacterium]